MSDSRRRLGFYYYVAIFSLGAGLATVLDYTTDGAVPLWAKCAICFTFSVVSTVITRRVLR